VCVGFSGMTLTTCIPVTTMWKHSHISSCYWACHYSSWYH